MSGQRHALLISLSVIESDPRLRRQIDWLTGAGWSVDTLGLGSHPTIQVRNHFPLRDQAKWVRSRLGAVLIYSVLAFRRKFALLVEDRVPPEANRLISQGEYSLVVFNDFDFIPWIRNRAVFTPKALAAHIHLDLHEYRERKPKIDSPWRLLTRSYHSAIRTMIGDPLFATRSTVASGIADLYAADFGVPELAIVRNSPPFVDQDPTPVDPADIKLIFHGLASRARGLWEIVDAMRVLDSRFSATFMLTHNKTVNADIAAYAKGVDRVRIVPPAPMRELAAVVNQYDLEIMFYRPNGRNLEFALPNKFFEAIQGRLGVVIGESPMMSEIVRDYGNGVIVSGWEASELAATLNALTAERVTELKAASNRAAADLNAEVEGAAFLRAVGVESSTA